MADVPNLPGCGRVMTCPDCRGAGGSCILIHDGSEHSREACRGAQWRDCLSCKGTGEIKAPSAPAIAAALRVAGAALGAALELDRAKTSARGSKRDNPNGYGVSILTRQEVYDLHGALRLIGDTATAVEASGSDEQAAQ